MKTTLIKPVLMGFLFFVLAGCLGVGSSNSYTSEELGLRKTDLLDDNVALLGFAYVATPAGEAENIDRAFENAPPLIPHDVEDMMEITKDINMCTSCHLPEIAEGVNATAMPKSHFTSILPKSGVNEVSYTDLGEQMSDTRYNCTQCHVPQVQGAAPMVANTFKAEFRNAQDISSSNLIDTLNEGVQ